jgi:hypothetical protein
VGSVSPPERRIPGTLGEIPNKSYEINCKYLNKGLTKYVIHNILFLEVIMKRAGIRGIILFFLVFSSIKLVFADEVIIYSFEKPDDMAAVVREMRNIASSFRGTFSGDEYRGSFSGFGSNAVVTYSVNENMIIYTLTFVGNVNNTMQQKLLHSFTIDLPRNIVQALEAVRGGVEGKGGFFYGNEYGGYFRNSGIMGNYVVGERVTFYIFEKPFIIPNSLIEREIRNYFIGK